MGGGPVINILKDIRDSIQELSKGKNGGGGGSNGVTAAELKTLIETAAQVAPSQTIRLEHAPLTIAPTNYPKPPENP